MKIRLGGKRMKEKFARFSEYLQKSRAEVDRRNLCSLTVFSWVFFGLLGISHIAGVLGGTGGAPAFFSFAAPGAELLYAVLLTLTKGAPRRANRSGGQKAFYASARAGFYLF